MKENTFKVRARLIEQLGEQLIKNESIALIELIKNAYDADASNVNLIMKNIDNPETGQIIIEDNGTGMDADIIRNVWLEAGSDYKKKMIENNQLTPVYKRRPLGEKGIGRFAVHKLGRKIEIISKKETEKEVYVLIDWDKFENVRYIHEIGIEVVEREPEVFINQTGTRLIISKLKNKWSPDEIKNIYRSILSFNNPFSKNENFNVNFEIDKKEWTEGLVTIDKILDYALFFVEAEIEEDRIKKFRYEFRPYSTMDKLQNRMVDENNQHIKKILKIVDKDNNPINTGNYKIGPIKFTAYIYDQDSKILKLGVSDTKGLKEYLKINGGIRIYRDGVRVYDYGEPENDWLELDIRRVNVPAKRISNNLILAAIELDRMHSTDLIEKTNREGFIENNAYLTFKSAILYLLNVIESERNIDKEKIRTYYGSKEKSQPVVNSIRDLKNVIEEKIKDEPTRMELIKYLDRIEKDYEIISETLLKAAGAGLNLSVVVHEMEKIISELKILIDKEIIGDRIKTLVKHLSNLIEGYSVLIRSRGKKKENIIKIIDQAIFNMEYRLEYHKIEIIKEYRNFCGNTEFYIVRNLLLNSLMNIIDNSIWWLDYSKKGMDDKKKIFINLIEYPYEHISIVIADNGCGFALPADEMVKPFVSAKPDGMGLGLHIVNEVMLAHQGKLLFPDESDFKDFVVPEEFKTGAIVVLSFKNEQVWK
ncbi:MAG: ATP-binding protein [Thermoflavifilum sp.]|uniref:ATP-binding protein n=1 Tax=Thermoflavifilum sp. TaxID=1968839 RepID=UPI0018A3FCC0|nr:ATP-binding protein [Thermoflavifilum sp.]QOR76331.1 MAG: ATP-binding protein [Thermoflavifilum sp.]